jgi:hypothetical protein
MALTRPKISNINTDIVGFLDPITVLHQGATQPNVDVGFLFNRANGLVPNAAMYWSETLQSFSYVLTANTGVTDSNITPSSYANVSIGNLLMINNAGIFVGGNIGFPGSVLASDGTKSYWTAAGGFSGGSVPLQTIFANTIQSTSTTTGAVTIGGGLGVAANVYVGGNLIVAGNTYAQNTLSITTSVIDTGSMSVTGLTTLSNISMSGNINTNTQISSNKIATTGNIVISSGVASTNSSTGALTVIGGAGISGSLYISGNVVSTGTAYTQIPAGTTAERPGTGALGMIRYNSTISSYEGYGAGSAWSSLGGVKSVDGKAYISAETSAGAGDDVLRFYSGSTGTSTQVMWASGANISILPSTTSSSTTTGALQVTGGVGVQGALYAGSVFDNGNRVLTSLGSSGTGNLTVSVSAPASTTVSLPTTGPGATTVGSSTSIPVITTDAYGRISALTSSAVSTTINLAGTSGTGSVAGGGTLTFASSNGITATASSSTITINSPQDLRTTASPTFVTPSVSSLLAGTTTVAVSSISGAALGTINDATTGWSAPGIGFGSGTGGHGGIVYGGGQFYFGTENGSASGTMTTRMTLTNAGVLTAYNNILPSANVSYNLGSTTAWWNMVYGKAVQAQYADLAENYVPDHPYEPGTVVVFGGEAEITVTNIDHDSAVAGVVSTNPAYLMNSMTDGLPIALQGRVPCRVQGPVKKGQVLVTSTTPGVAQTIDNTKFIPGCVVGKALESINTNSIETIEVVVGKH